MSHQTKKYESGWGSYECFVPSTKNIQMHGADVIHGAEFERHCLPKIPSTLAHCTFPGSPTAGVLPLGYTAEMGTLYPHVSNHTYLVPRKERKDGVGKGSCAL